MEHSGLFIEVVKVGILFLEKLKEFHQKLFVFNTDIVLKFAVFIGFDFQNDYAVIFRRNQYNVLLALIFKQVEKFKFNIVSVFIT